MKKLSKRLLAMLLVIAMLFSFSTVGYAADDELYLILYIEEGGYAEDWEIFLNCDVEEIVSIQSASIYNFENVRFHTGAQVKIPVDSTNIVDKLKIMILKMFSIDNINAVCKISSTGGENIVFSYEFTYDSMLYPGGIAPSVQNKYSFLNPKESIDKKKYQKLYGDSKGWLLFNIHEYHGKHGLCYGMAATTATLLEDMSLIYSFPSNVIEYGNAQTISEIDEKSYSHMLNMTALEFIKYGYLCQFAFENDSLLNDLKKLYSAVKSYVDGEGPCVVISVWQGTKNNRKNGHALLATGMKETEDEYIIAVNDSNFYTTPNELFISKDFSSWHYSVEGRKFADGTPYDYNSSNGIIVYDTPGTFVYNVVALAGGKTRTATNYLNDNKLLVSSTSSLVENENLSEIFVTGESGSEDNNSNKLYWLDEDMNSIELSAEDDNSEITVSDVNSSVTATLDSKENASFYVDDDSVNKIRYSSAKNKNAHVVFSSVDENGEIVSTTLTGTANGDEVVASETEDGIQVTGLNDITVTYETPDGTAETKADVKDGSTVNITVNDDENKVETDWQDKDETETDEECKHSDANHDGICDACSEDFTKGCSCNCHGNAFMQFLHKIVSFLRKLFGMTQYQYCNCGKAHW